MRTYKNYTDEDIIKYSALVKSLSGLLRQFNLKCAGANFINMKRNLQRLNVDTSHWTGKAWNKGEQLKDYSDYTKITYLKKHLINDRGHQCENCSITEWLGAPLVLEVDHIDGDRTNNKEDNLKLLCPNCHSQTPTWRNRKK